MKRQTITRRATLNSNRYSALAIASTFMASLIWLTSPTFGDVFNDHVDIEIDDVAAGVGGVAGVDQVPVMLFDLELEHSGPGGFDVDITHAPYPDFFVTIVHWAPLDGIPIGAYDWKIEDIECRDGNGDIINGYVADISLPPGNFNIMPTTALSNTDTSVKISTGGFGSLSGGAFADYIVTVVIPGDVNRDGAVNLLDVDSFVEAMQSGPYQPEADVNRDGAVNLLDVDPFVDLIAGN